MLALLLPVSSSTCVLLREAQVDFFILPPVSGRRDRRAVGNVICRLFQRLPALTLLKNVMLPMDLAGKYRPVGQSLSCPPIFRHHSHDAEEIP